MSEEDYLAKSIEVKQRTRELWQERWAENSGRAAWTKRLLPSVGRWVDADASNHLTFHLTQVLTGHGVFAKYLAKIGNKDTPYCWWCPEVEDDPEHTLFVCSKFYHERRELAGMLGREAGPGDVVEIMCGEEALRWLSNTTLRYNAREEVNRRREVFTEMVRTILTLKESKERAREADAAAEDQNTDRPRHGLSAGIQHGHH